MIRQLDELHEIIDFCKEMTMTTIFTREGDSGPAAGAATNITVMNDDPHNISHFITAARNSEGNVELIRWYHNGFTVYREYDSRDNFTDVEVSEISMAQSGVYIITAVRTGSGILRLLSWEERSGGINGRYIHRISDSGNNAGEASLIAIQPVGDTELVTACSTGAGILRLILWDHQGGPLRRRDSGNQAGEVALIALTVFNDLCLTAVRTSSGKLKLISWSIHPEITRLGDSGDQAGEVSEIAMDGSVTAVRTKEGILKLINWDISSDGTTITRLGDSDDQAGQATNIAICKVTSSRYVTASRTASGTLKLIAFDVAPSGAMTRTGDTGNQAGAISEVALSKFKLDNRLVTAVRDAVGHLKIIVWKMQD